MLQSKINYLNYLEANRHNLETEALGWANYVLEQLKFEEQKRHNLATEDIEMKKLAETIRHNLKSEEQKDRDLGISMYLADTKAGELRVKEANLNLQQVVEPLKAQGAYLKGKAAYVESGFAKQKADAATTQAHAAYQKTVNEGVKNAQNSGNTQLKQKQDYELGTRKADTEARNADINQQRADTYKADTASRALQNFGLQDIEPVPGAGSPSFKSKPAQYREIIQPGSINGPTVPLIGGK